MITRLIALALVWVWTAPAHAADPDDPRAYALSVPVTTAPGSSLQRLNLPARVLIAIRGRDMADVRVFNASGQAVPIAMAPAVRAQQRKNVPLPVMPILGAADALAVTGVSLTIDDRQRASVVRVDGSPRAVTGSKLLGILLDTRRIADPVAALTLDLEVPAGQPITFTIESSTDLKDWQPVADKVLYRNSRQTGTASIAFPARSFQGHYLRVMWQAASRILSPVSIHSAYALTQRSHDGGAAPRAVLIAPPSSDPHVIELDVPFSAKIAAMEITPNGADTIVPIRILGRNRSEEAWTPVASGAVSRITRDGQTRINPAIDLGGSLYRTWRIEADARTAGFVSAPTIAARLEPTQILFLATGPAPFTLAAGQAEARSVFLLADDLVQASGTTASPPIASVPAEPDPVITITAAPAGTSWRRMALWGVLLAGTALLAAMVWLLMRRREPAT